MRMMTVDTAEVELQNGCSTHRLAHPLAVATRGRPAVGPGVVQGFGAVATDAACKEQPLVPGRRRLGGAGGVQGVVWAGAQDIGAHVQRADQDGQHDVLGGGSDEL